MISYYAINDMMQFYGFFMLLVVATWTICHSFLPIPNSFLLRVHKMHNNSPIRLDLDDDPTSLPLKPLEPLEDRPYEPLFTSQNPIDMQAIKDETDLSDPKQLRVIAYIIVSLIPVVFLIPLMLGSRDLLPLDLLPVPLT